MTGDEDEAFPRHTQDSAKGKSCCWRSKGIDEGAAEPKSPKRWRRKARGGPSEGWISKKAPDERGDGISTPESASRAHTGCHVKLRLWEKIGAWRHVDDSVLAGFPSTSRSASCASESEVSSRRRAWRAGKSH